MAYPLGTEVRLTGEFTGSAGAAADPTTVTVFVKAPGQFAATQYTLAADQVKRVLTGTYTLDLILDTPGQWLYCWQGGGAVEAATFDIPIVVAPSALRTT